MGPFIRCTHEDGQTHGEGVEKERLEDSVCERVVKSICINLCDLIAVFMNNHFNSPSRLSFHKSRQMESKPFI